jgi:hypothetical protein
MPKLFIIILIALCLGLIIGIYIFLSNPIFYRNMKSLGYAIPAKVLLYKESRKEYKEPIWIDLKHNHVGTPICCGYDDFYIYREVFYHSECSGWYVCFDDGAKRSVPFNPQLQFTSKEITFKMSPDAQDFDCDSIRIVNYRRQPFVKAQNFGKGLKSQSLTFLFFLCLSFSDISNSFCGVRCFHTFRVKNKIA